MTPVDHGELQATVTQALFPGFAGDQVEPPAVVAGLQDVHIKRLETLVLPTETVSASSGGVVLIEAVEHHLVAVFKSIGPMQDKRG